MALIQDNWSHFRNGVTGLRMFLDQFKRVIQEAGGHIRVSGYKQGDHCSMVNMDQYSFPASLWTALRTESRRLQNCDPEELVHVRTGTKYRPCRIRKRRKQIIQWVQEACEKHNIPDRVAQLMDHLNNLPTRRFTNRFTDEKLKELYCLADSLYKGRPNAHRQAKNTISWAALYKKPLYKVTHGTVRLSPASPSLLTVRSAIRRRALKDCIEIDMASAQLALVAALWDVQPLLDFLDRGANWWKEIISFLRGQFPQNTYRKADFGFVKGLLKGNTYSTTYGMSRENIRRFGNCDRMTSRELFAYRRNKAKLELIFRHPIEDIGQAFLEHPIIEALLEARDVQLGFIEDRGYASDCFGRMIEVESCRNGKKGRTARSVLAATVQSAEMYVMLSPAESIMAAEGKNRPRLMLWQHDGFTFKVRDRDIDMWVGRLDEALQQGCRKLERERDLPRIHTQMEVKYDPRKVVQ